MAGRSVALASVLGLGILAVALATPVTAQAPSIVLHAPWVRRPPVAAGDAGSGARENTAGYVGIENRGSAPDALVAARTDVAERVEIHRTRNMSGMLMMEPVPSVPVAAGARIDLKPGGYHLMLIGIMGPLARGETVTLELTFERAGAVSVRAEVR